MSPVASADDSWSSTFGAPRAEPYGPWHKPGSHFSVPAYWDERVQAAIPTKERRVGISDTTLSEGEDMAGCHLSWPVRLEIARKLSELGVEEMQTPMGAPAEEIRDFVRKCKREGLNQRILHKVASIGLPLKRHDDWRAWIKRKIDIGADRTMVFGYYPEISYLSDFQEGPMTFDELIDDIQTLVSESVRMSGGGEILWAPTPPFRHRLDTLTTMCRAAMDVGACGVYLADSRGQSNPMATRLICQEVREAIGPGKAMLVQHHNDLGMATANQLAAAEGGADLLDAALCGVSERSGVAALEEVAAVLYAYGWDAGIRLELLQDAADYVAWAYGIDIHRLKPIIGWQARIEEGWGHRDPGDPPEGPVAIAAEVFGQRFESVIGPSCFVKIPHSQAMGVVVIKEIIEDFLNVIGLEYDHDDLVEIRRRTQEALLSRRDGFIRLPEFEEIARGVVEARLYAEEAAPV